MALSRQRGEDSVPLKFSELSFDGIGTRLAQDNYVRPDQATDLRTH